jgi:phospholipase/carboxylesterase
MTDEEGPHQNRPLVTGGAPLSVADAAMVLLHGRGGSAAGIVDTADAFYRHGLALVAPEAAYNRWYPSSFLAPREANEPELSSALRAVDDAVAEVAAAGIDRERIVLLGFSQGGCLAAEYAAREPRRYGGLAVLSGGLIGPAVDPAVYGNQSRGGSESEEPAGGTFAETPVLVGCSDEDPHVPLERVHETTAVFERLDGDVTERIYAGADHAITDDEVARVSEMVESLVG